MDDQKKYLAIAAAMMAILRIEDEIEEGMEDCPWKTSSANNYPAGKENAEDLSAGAVPEREPPEKGDPLNTAPEKG